MPDVGSCYRPKAVVGVWVLEFSPHARLRPAARELHTMSRTALDPGSPSDPTDHELRTRQAALVATINASSISQLDRALCDLMKLRASELETAEADFDCVCAEHLRDRDDNAFGIILSYARRECAAASINHDTFEPVLKEAHSLYNELWRFVSAPKPPYFDPQNDVDDRELILPLGYCALDSAYKAAHLRLQLIRERLQATVYDLVNFRDTAVGKRLPAECLPFANTPDAPPLASKQQKSDGGKPPAAADADPPQYVTLDQMAAMVNRSKRTVEKLLTRKLNPLPNPDISGGGGKPNEWKWAIIRLWLEKEYERKLPSVYPKSPR